MLTDVFITESQKFFVLTILKVQEVMWIIIADYYLILPASSDHLTVRASIILWLKCPLLAAIVFHFALHCTSLLCKKPYYLQIVKSSLLHFLQLRLHLHTEESADMNPLDLSTEKFGPCLRLMILHHYIFFVFLPWFRHFQLLAWAVLAIYFFSITDVQTFACLFIY